MTATVEDRRTAAERLLRQSAAHTHDPVTEIDWERPLDPDRFYTPPHRSSLYGTHLWDSLDQQQRIALTRGEVASVASVGIWFELILMQMLVRYAYDRDATEPHIQYALTEIGDECRHSVMFGRMIDAFGLPAYGPGRLAQVLGRIFKTTSSGPLVFASALYVEEVLDALQRESMRDESLQPLVRAVSRIHVIEESRHMRYAAGELRRTFAALSPAAQAVQRLELAVAVTVATRRLIHPDVYASVGLDPREARRVALRNPHWRASLAWAARKGVSIFEEVGMISGPSRLIWRRAGLLD